MLKHARDNVNIEGRKWEVNPIFGKVDEFVNFLRGPAIAEDAHRLNDGGL